MKKLSIGIVVAALALGTGGCKRTLDVNTNPNSPADVPVSVLLPSAQASISTQLGDYFQIVGGIWGQYWTQSPNSSQYRPFEQYFPGSSSANLAWSELYAGALTDLNKVIEKADGAAATQSYAGIARILKGFTFQLLTDNFNDIPFSEALQGMSGNTSPKYDRQEDVYNGIIALVKQGRDSILDNNPMPGADDLIYGTASDPSQWRRFANTLLLRMYLRLAYVNPGLAQTGIAELAGHPDGFIGAGGTGEIKYRADFGNTNPLYSEIVNLGRTQNLIASATATNNFQDERLFVFYTGASGLQQGFYNIPVPGNYSTPSDITGGNANPSNESVAQSAPVRFITDYESYFLQAEAAARGWLPGSAEAYYEQGVTASFVSYGTFLSGVGDTVLDSPMVVIYTPEYAAQVALFGQAEGYLHGELVEAIDPTAAYPAGGTFQEQLAAIITQKWFAMCGNQNIEAWTEWRRTGYPDFFTFSPNSRIGQNVLPVRLPYPDNEITNNQKFPGQKLVTDRVWWDVQ